MTLCGTLYLTGQLADFPRLSCRAFAVQSSPARNWPADAPTKLNSS